MKVISTRAAVNTQMLLLAKENKTIGFVATMGALHEGHMELIRISKKQNDITLCSIFVNPLQFNKLEDLKKYPQSLEQDIRFLEEEGCDFLFAPIAEEFYKNVIKEEYNFGILGKVMEAEYRPDHFEGVATVISELFKAVCPTRAYFGEKDYQQLAVINWLVHHEKSQVEIVACSTVRNDDGLALSSRNKRVSKEGIKIATKIFETMSFCKSNLDNLSPKDLTSKAIGELSNEFEVEYLEIVDERSFEKHEEWKENVPYRVFVAANLEGVRLIDNLSLNH
ncbi:MAG: pantoate--beta-alanine ligase [Flavobacteriales bacterium]|nr:pantoate--beta-alanine ligase [Flavobacteriales bacterium]